MQRGTYLLEESKVGQACIICRIGQQIHLFERNNSASLDHNQFQVASR